MADEEGDRYKSTESRLNARLRELLAESGRTQLDLGIHLGHSQSWVSKRMSGVLHWEVSDLDALADFFGMPVPELFFNAFGKWDRRHTLDRRNPKNRRWRSNQNGQESEVSPAGSRMMLETEPDGSPL